MKENRESFPGIDPEIFRPTTATLKLSMLSKRLRGVPGGTSAGKTYGIIPILITRASKIPNLEISIVSESMPHLKKGALKDFKKIMQGCGRWRTSSWHGGDNKYTFHNGSYIEFFSADNAGKVHGPRRKKLYVNEANRIPFETYHALAIRTTEDIWIDFNPVGKFWYHDEIVGDPDWEECRLTYADNEALAPSIVKEIEKALYKGFHDPGGSIDNPKNIKDSYWANWWRVYGLGLVGITEGQIFKNVKHINFRDMPMGNKVVGLDLGYTHDPTVGVAVWKHQGKIYRHQLFYEVEMKTKELVDALMKSGVDEDTPIVMDHDHTLRDELKEQGFNVFLAHKPPGSVLSGIQALQSEELYTSHESQDLIEEEDRYFWDMKDGKSLNRPVGEWDHGWDATRYGYDYLMNPGKKHYLSQKKVKPRKPRRRKIMKLS